MARSNAEKLARTEKSRLAEECAKLDPDFEKALAEEGYNASPQDSSKGLKPRLT